MPSKVDICNRALTRISEDRIQALTDDTSAARDCNNIYDSAVAEVMALGPWPSVRRRATLAQLTDVPAFEFSYTYQLPTSPQFLALISLNECKPGEIEFIIEGDKLLCNEAEVAIRYIAFIDDPNGYDVYLQQAIIEKLVAELGYKKTGQLGFYRAALDYADQKAKMLLSRASFSNENSQYVNSDTFVDARNNAWPNEGRLRDLE